MGIGLGLAAGGIADGYALGEKLQTERADRAAKTAAARRLADQDQRDAEQRAMTRGIHTVGDTITDNNYSPAASVEASRRGAIPAQAPQHRAGLMGALARYLDPQAAAVASGVAPAPAQPGAIPTPGAAPAGPAQPPQAGPGDVEGVTVQGVKPPPRKYTEEDIARERWAAARGTGDAAGERAAAKELHDVVSKNTKIGIMGADLPTLANMYDAAAGRHDTNLEQDEKTGSITLYHGSQVVAKFPNRDQLNADAIAAVDDPMVGLEMLKNYKKEDREAAVATASIKASAATVQHYHNLDALAGRGDLRTQEDFDTKRQERKLLTDAFDFIKHPDRAITDPDGWEAAASTIEQYAPEIAKGNVATRDDTKGTTNSTPVNKFRMYGEDYRDAFSKSDARQYMSTVTLPDGSRSLAVRDPTTKKPLPVRSQAEGERMVKRLYSTATKPATAAPSATPRAAPKVPSAAGLPTDPTD